MSTTSCTLTEGAYDAYGDTQKEVSVDSDGFPACSNIQQARNSLLTPDSESFEATEVSLDSRSANTASPTCAVENIPKEHTKGRKRKGIHAFFHKTWKTVKRPILGCHKTRVEPIVPPLKPDTHPSNPNSMSVPCASSLEPDACPAVPVNTPNTDSVYPTQMSESLQSLFISSITPLSLTEGSEHENTSLEVNVSSGMFNNTDQPWSSSLTIDTDKTDVSAEDLECDSSDTLSGFMVSPLNTVENSLPEHHTKGRRRKAICMFFQKTWRTVKSLFSCHESIVLSLQPDTYPSYTDSTSFSRVSSLEQRPAREWTDSDSSSVAGCSWLEQCPAVNTHGSTFLSFEPSDGYVYSHYIMGDLLGKGGFGTVHEGTRISDGQKVAIKFLSKSKNNRYLFIPGHPKPLLTEVALMLMMRQPPISPYVIQMYEWFEGRREVAVVMEYPQPCESLHDVIHRHYELGEKSARFLMRQAVLAVQHCIRNGVFHSDIHPGNMLVNTSTLELKLIDFGCGHLFCNSALSSYNYVGVPTYCSPEVQTKPTFQAAPANVWSLGLVLFEMVNGCLPYAKSEEVLFVNPNLSNGWAQTQAVKCFGLKTGLNGRQVMQR